MKKIPYRLLVAATVKDSYTNKPINVPQEFYKFKTYNQLLVA